MKIDLTKRHIFPDIPRGLSELDKMWAICERIDVCDYLIMTYMDADEIKRLYPTRSYYTRILTKMLHTTNYHYDENRHPLFPVGECDPDPTTYLDPIEGDSWFAQLCEAPPTARPVEIIAHQLNPLRGTSD